MFTWLPMTHLPHPPEIFVQRARALAQRNDLPDMVENMRIPENIRYRTIQRQGVTMPSRVQRGRDMGTDWEEWVRENIISEFYETGFRVNAPVGISDTHGAHTDPGRKWKLYYLLERGGDAVTKFYKEKGQPVVRDQSDELGTWNNIDELEIIEQVQWPMYQWVLINTMVIHSVENIQGYRCNFTISIRPQDLLNLYRR